MSLLGALLGATLGFVTASLAAMIDHRTSCKKAMWECTFSRNSIIVITIGCALLMSFVMGYDTTLTPLPPLE
ncbi:MAG: hypothetical protein KBC02_01105 [Candidatus Pacebacteria bacterium]|nr:hypothetical protein [Candidatus Paceibacterota bacterium]